MSYQHHQHDRLDQLTAPYLSITRNPGWTRGTEAAVGRRWRIWASQVFFGKRTVASVLLGGPRASWVLDTAFQLQRITDLDVVNGGEHHCRIPRDHARDHVRHLQQGTAKASTQRHKTPPTATGGTFKHSCELGLSRGGGKRSPDDVTYFEVLNLVRYREQNK